MDQNRLQDRVHHVNRYINALLGLCENQPLCEVVPEVRRLTGYLFESGRFVEPLPSQAESLTGREHGPIKFDQYCDPRMPLKIVVIDSQDEALGGYWKDVLCTKGMVAYVSSLHMVILRMDYFETPAVLALSFLHELLHAERSDKEGRAGQKVPANRWEIEREEERIVYLLEGRIMQALDVINYTVAMEAAITFLDEAFDRTEWCKDPKVGRLPVRDSELAAILGSADTMEDIHARRTGFSIIAFLEFARRCASKKNKCEELQRRVIDLVYAQLGIKQ